MSKLKKDVKKTVAKIKNPKARAAAQKELNKALKNNKGSTPAISKKELERIQAAAAKFGSGKNVQYLTNITHPKNRPVGSPPSGGGASSPPLPSYDSYQPYDPGPPPPVRVPERDVVQLVDQSIDSETIVNLLFENIGANELTKFVRHDTVEGINPYYDIISNLTDVKRRFDPALLISLQKSALDNFDIFAIKLQDKIPSDEYLIENNLLDQDGNPVYVYFAENGDLVIEVVNVADSELVEVQIDSNGTIYRIEEL